MKLKALALATALLAGTSLSAHAAVVAALGFADIGSPTVNTGNINTATTFNIGDLFSTTSGTGALAGLSHQDFGPVSFMTTNGTSLSFGDSVFGSFQSASITLASNVPGVVSFYILGDWTPGTYGGVPAGSYAGSFTISFTQTTAISDSATFAVPPGPAPGAPELSTWAMMGVGFAGLAFAGYRSSRKSVSIAA